MMPTRIGELADDSADLEYLALYRSKGTDYVLPVDHRGQLIAESLFCLL
jgi:hypothetical protein